MSVGWFVGAHQTAPNGSSVHPGPLTIQERYGQPTQTDLEDVVARESVYSYRTVRVRGWFDPGLDEHWRLRDGTTEVLLLPVGMGKEVLVLSGRGIEVVGVVRPLQPKRTPVAGQDPEVLEHPLLPPLPAPTSGLPHLSISFYEIVPDERYDRGRNAAGSSPLHDLLARPERRPGKTIRVVGQFRGRNLFGDLPALPTAEHRQWVLKDGATSVWVVGKDPRGKGFLLDPGLRSDTRFFLEVTGKIERCGDMPCLRAKTIRLAPAPKREPE